MALSTVEASYTEESDVGFDTVTILPDGISIRVQDVQ
jgi:hypothetical protein